VMHLWRGRLAQDFAYQALHVELTVFYMLTSWSFFCEVCLILCRTELTGAGNIMLQFFCLETTSLSLLVSNFCWVVLGSVGFVWFKLVCGWSISSYDVFDQSAK
jgi:hypothetical protein